MHSTGRTPSAMPHSHRIHTDTQYRSPPTHIAAVADLTMLTPTLPTGMPPSYSKKMLVRICCIALSLVPSQSFIVSPRGWIPTTKRFSTRIGKDEEPDLFDYFDPLLSPHAYPNGVSPDRNPIKKQIANEEREKPFIVRSTSTEARVDPSQVFDPTLSPHAYPNGAPSIIVGDKHLVKNSVSRVGILLVDHGSRNKASNDRLQELARTYQRTVESNVVVRACHMEIAHPSIPEGLEALLKEGVDEIVCHPYFLSPDGRHVSEDIPRIVKGAIESLNIEIPILTTEPVGANMDRMIGIIQSIVEENSLLGKSA